MKKYISKHTIRGTLGKKIEKECIKNISKQKMKEELCEPWASETGSIRSAEIKEIVPRVYDDELEIVEVKETKPASKSAPLLDKDEGIKKEKIRSLGTLGEDEGRIISKLVVFGGYSGITGEEFQNLVGMSPQHISSLLSDLEIRDIIERKASNPEEIKLCRWMRPLLGDISKDRGLNAVETHLLNVICILKGGDNITQKELGRRANVPASTLSETVIPMLEDLYMIERVSVGSGKLVRLII